MSPPSEDDTIGALSLIIWSLTIVVLIKYVILILNADDHGLGGTFALYSVTSRGIQTWLKNDALFKRINLVLSSVALTSLAMVISDGILTPAISGASIAAVYPPPPSFPRRGAVGCAPRLTRPDDRACCARRRVRTMA